MFISGKMNTPVMTTNKVLGNYLMKHGVPLLSRDGDEMVFARTKQLENKMTHLPFSIKMFGKVVGSG